MTISSQQLIIFFSGFSVAVLIVWAWMHSRNKMMTQNQNSLHNSELQLLNQKIESLDLEGSQLNKELVDMQTDLKQYKAENTSLLTKYTSSHQHLKDVLQTMDELKIQLQKSELARQNLTQENTRLTALIKELETLNEQQQKSADEKLALLTEAREGLQNQFKTLANEIFDEKGKKFSEQNKEKLDAILNPFSKNLQDFRQKVNEVYVHEAKERASLKTEILGLKELNQQLNKEALNLTTALKGDKKTQGNWGELVLERVLEQSGLRKGHEYETQGGFRDATDNKIMKPDVVIYLPQDKAVVIDSKVSLIAYEKYSSGKDEKEQLEALNEHITAIENHIKTLSEKDYSNLKGLTSLDFVLMFIPIEPAFNLAFQNNDKLFTQAFDKKIVVVTPTTLLATLKTIENLWRYEKQNQNARIIAEKAGNLYDKFRGFVEDMEKLGNQMNTAHETYQNALNKLSKGKGNLIGQSKNLLNLGIKVKKEIPKSIVDDSDISEED